MSKIKPFQAVVYNSEQVRDLSAVVCPPYDVISVQKQEHYHSIDPYNFIHLILGKDIPGEDKYRRAGVFFREWLKKGILKQEQMPAIYFYSQQYNIMGERKTRYGFIALLRLPDKDSVVFGHENTRAVPKEDRFRLIKQVKANLSPIFSVFLDKNRVIQRVLRKYIQGTLPFIEVTDDEKTVHKVWKISAPEAIAEIQKGVTGENMFIADGHHRFEVACMYRELMKGKPGNISGEENFNYVLSYFTNTDPRGLTILPIHRLLKLENMLDMDDFKARLKEYFHVEEVKDRDKFFFLMQRGGRTEHVIGMYKDRKRYFLRLKNIKILDREMREKPREYRTLDVSILNHLVFKKILGLEADQKDLLTYSPHAEEFIERCDDDGSLIAFFLNPVKIEQIISVALNGQKMPPKSTYFYPKVLSGLVVNKLE